MADPHLHLWQNNIQARRADLIICISPNYIDHYKDNGSNVIHVPHGISADEFDVNQKEVEGNIEKYGNYVLIIGAITKYVDVRLLKEVCGEGLNLVVVGSEIEYSEEWRELKNMQNVFYLGEMNGKKLKEFVSAAQFCLIAYKFDFKKRGLSGSPLKALNYLAQHKLIITSIDSEIKELENKGIYWAKNKYEYICFVRKAMEGNLTIDKNKIDEYLQDHYYPILIKKILGNLS